MQAHDAASVETENIGGVSTATCICMPQQTETRHILNRLTINFIVPHQPDALKHGIRLHWCQDRYAKMTLSKIA